MSSTIVLLLLAVMLMRDYGKRTNVKGRHQLQLHAALARLNVRDDRIIEYTPHDVDHNYTEAVTYCRRLEDNIAQPKDSDELLDAFESTLQCFCVTLFHQFRAQCC